MLRDGGGKVEIADDVRGMSTISDSGILRT